ncbi:MAG TPA: hypothetical protein VF278_04890 [Pirellulales bacterium]
MAISPAQPAFAVQGKAAKKAAAPAGRFRAAAPGVETVITPDLQAGDTFSRHDMVEVLAADPEFGERPFSQGRSPAKDTVFSRNIWCLELSFKPMRMVWVDVPATDGRFDRKLIWYLLYRVKNTGKLVTRSVTGEGEIKAEIVDSEEPIEFAPRIWLESWDSGKVYPDRIIPVALPVIEKREDAGRRLLNAKALLPEAPSRLLTTVEMERAIPPSPAGQDLGLWGVATWEDIDPTTDHFSIYIQGLTNSYQWIDAKDADQYVYKKGDPIGTGRKLLQKTLRLNFWRPSDKFYEHESEFRYGYREHPGIERFDLKPEEQVDYSWIYR